MVSFAELAGNGARTRRNCSRLAGVPVVLDGTFWREERSLGSGPSEWKHPPTFETMARAEHSPAGNSWLSGQTRTATQCFRLGSRRWRNCMEAMGVSERPMADGP